MFNPLSGGHGGVEEFFATPFGEQIGDGRRSPQCLE